MSYLYDKFCVEPSRTRTAIGMKWMMTPMRMTVTSPSILEKNVQTMRPTTMVGRNGMTRDGNF